MADPRETLARIRAQADAATEGPWEVGDRYHCQAADMCGCLQDYGPLIDTYQHPEWGTMHVHRRGEAWWNDGVLYRPAGGPPGEVCSDATPADAEFIAHARTDVPRLVDALEKVLELHIEGRPFIGHGFKQRRCECGATWPCPTVTAITQALHDH